LSALFYNSFDLVVLAQSAEAMLEMLALAAALGALVRQSLDDLSRLQLFISYIDWLIFTYSGSILMNLYSLLLSVDCTFKLYFSVYF